MKFQTTAGLLAKALRTLQPVIERRSAIPILSCVKFDGRTIAANDLNLELSIAIPAATARGEAVIAHRPLLGLVRNIPGDDTITIRAGKDEADISFSSGRYSLPCLPVGDFPEIFIGEQTPIDIDDLIERAIRLWSNEGDTVLSPFMGIGSEGWGALKAKRRFVGFELKDSYYRQAIKNLTHMSDTAFGGDLFQGDAA